MNHKYLFFPILLAISLILTACSPSQATIQTLPSEMLPAISTALPASTTVPPTNIPIVTLVAYTPTLENSQTIIVSVAIVSPSIPGSPTQDLYLEFLFNPGDVLPGTQIDVELSSGTLELTLPSGEKKSYPGIPADTGGMPFSSQSFENYSDKPSGPALRIPIETIPDISATGEYQISWHSENFQSNILVFDWDGEKISVQ